MPVQYEEPVIPAQARRLEQFRAAGCYMVPYADAGPLSAELLPNGTLKTYAGYPHGMPTTHADVINADLLDFIRS